jgi:hypothetical protein
MWIWERWRSLCTNGGISKSLFATEEHRKTQKKKARLKLRLHYIYALVLPCFSVFFCGENSFNVPIAEISGTTHPQ